jgi:hypothetical protein
MVGAVLSHDLPGALAARAHPDFTALFEQLDRHLAPEAAAGRGAEAIGVTP